MRNRKARPVALSVKDWVASIQELKFPGELSRGSSGSGVKRLQEWLVLNGSSLVVDGDFGAKTEDALVKLFDARVLREELWERLTASMEALFSSADLRDTPEESLFAVAMRAQTLSIKEIPPNSGAWVRLFMAGNEGMEYPWCAGFVSYLASFVSKVFFPEEFSPIYSMGCDRLATWGQSKGVFTKDVTQVIPGSVFLVPKSDTDWVHTGIVLSVLDTGEIWTVEGNTNSEGGREGVAVMRRMRDGKNLHYLKTMFV